MDILAGGMQQGEQQHSGCAGVWQGYRQIYHVTDRISMVLTRLY